MFRGFLSIVIIVPVLAFANASLAQTRSGLESPTVAQPSAPPAGTVAILPATLDWKPIAERVESAALGEYSKNPVGAVSVGLIAQNAVVWTRHFGHIAGPDSPAPNGSTVYRLGSITKNFTALMFIKLEQEDRCTYSDPIGKWVPEFSKVPNQPPSGTQPTLVQLATHTGGLAREPDDEKEEFDVGTVAEWENVLSRMVSKIRFGADPGSGFNYSNVGYVLLGSALGKAAAMPYTTYVVEKILKPLEMNDTVFELTPELRARMAVGHVVGDRGAIDTERPRKELDGRGYRVPNGGLFSTLDDMCRWTRLQMGDASQTVIDPKVLADSQRRLIIVGPKLGSGYGIGVQVRRFGETVVFGHNGGVPGYQADFLFNPETKVGIVILRSAVGDEFDSIAIMKSALLGGGK